MSEKTAPKKKTATRTELGTGKDAPTEVKEILGGPPVALPQNFPARRVTSAPRHQPDSFRESNPLFDEPGETEGKAIEAIRHLRQAFGNAFAGASRAVSIGKAVLANVDGDLKTAAAREGFDLSKAQQVLDELEDFVDRHKPPKPEPPKDE